MEDEKKENSILDGEIVIDTSIFKKVKRTKKKSTNDEMNDENNSEIEYGYLEKIFGEKYIKFGNEEKIKENENYFSIIIGKNGVGKSSFIEYLINHFNSKKNNNIYINHELMYITFSAFDNLTNKSTEKYFYNGLKSKSHGAVKSTIFNENKFKLFKYFQNNKGKQINELLSYIYSLNLDIKISFVIEIEKLITELSKIKLTSEINFLQEYRKIIFKINPVKNKNIDGLKTNKTFIKYLNNNNIDGLNTILLEVFNKNKKTLTKIEDIYEKIDIYEKLDDKSILTLIIFSKIYSELKEFDYTKYNELFVKNTQGLKKNELNFSDFLKTLNGIRRPRSGTQAVDVDLYFKNNKKDFSVKNSSSGELVLLYTFLHLADFLDDNGKKIVIIDEPEISLHPQWQRDYIEKLNYGLDKLDIKNCFFLIVTHSPLIVLGSQDKQLNKKGELEKMYNVDVYGFVKDKTGKTTSKLINYISMDSIDEILGDDFGVNIYSSEYKKSIKQRYDSLQCYIKELGKQ